MEKFGVLIAVWAGKKIIAIFYTSKDLQMSFLLFFRLSSSLILALFYKVKILNPD